MIQQLPNILKQWVAMPEFDFISQIHTHLSVPIAFWTIVLAWGLTIGTFITLGIKITRRMSRLRLLRLISRLIKHLEQSLQKHQSFHQTLTEMAPIPIFIYDYTAHKIIFANPAYERLIGYGLPEIQALGADLRPALYPSKPAYGDLLERCYNEEPEEGIYEREYVWRHKNGDTVVAVAREKVFQRNANGSPTQVIGYVTDITDRKQKEISLQARMESAEAANRAKSAFLANMIHELRTPLNVMLGFAQVLYLDPRIQGEQQSILHNMLCSGEHLLALTNEILDLSKAEAGQSTLHCTEFSFSEFLEDLVQIFQVDATHKGLNLSLHTADSVPEYVYSDRLKLRQILMNLLSNALKFTPSGSITVRINATETSHNIYRFEIEVEDTGVGITPDDLNSIFQPFYQSQSGQKSQEGTGLGLSISRAYANLLGGDITVNSGVGQGSCFRLTFKTQWSKSRSYRDKTHCTKSRTP